MTSARLVTETCFGKSFSGHLGYGHPDQLDGLGCGCFLPIAVNPTAMLAQVGYFQKIGVQARRGYGPAEGILVHPR
jgi:hypothetical protein